MFDYPFEKYRFYEGNGKVVAVSTYAGKTVRGVAKCDPKDTFDIEKGRMLAAARCAEKVAKRRLARARNECRKASNDYRAVHDRWLKMNDYYEDAKVSHFNATMAVESILKTM